MFSAGTFAYNPPVTTAPANASLLERLFELRGRGSTVRAEMTGGVATFLTMAYIIAVNPLILKDAELSVQETVAATCLTVAVPTLLWLIAALFTVSLAL